jgi:xanthine dehydrogenase YagR molybdenum-binding subunit
MNRGVGACFAEVEVDTYTGNWRFVRAAYADSGKLINLLLAEGDMNDRSSRAWASRPMLFHGPEFPGTQHYAVGLFLAPAAHDYGRRIRPTCSSTPAAVVLRDQRLRDSAIGAPPGALANAIYNACGVRIREHPITREKIMA